MHDLRTLEETVQKHYDDTLRPVAKSLSVDLPRGPRAVAGPPLVLFLGNHSSGKSSFINHLIGAPRQKTGLAPTDDGFTIIAYGETEDELDGQSAVTHPEYAFGRLEMLGPNYLARMRLKTQPAEILRSMSLIDSPGMIDAAGTASGRGYDFAACVKAYAEMADLILFFFDPDKPGTTGETVSIFTETLAGLEHKLLIVLNKVDLFANIRDFARTYGTLCWNLSKTMQTKDVPHIFNMYLPGQAAEVLDRSGRVPLADFDVSREEVEREIRRSPARRADNLVSDLLAQSRLLHMQAKVGEAVGKRFRDLRLQLALVVAVPILIGLGGGFLTWSGGDWTVPAQWIGGGLLAAFLIGAGGLFYVRHKRARAASAEGLDSFFKAVYREELTLADRADLKSRWERARPRLLQSIGLLGISGLPRGFRFRRRVRQLGDLIERELPKLRRSLPAGADPGPDAAAEAEPAKAGS